MDNWFKNQWKDIKGNAKWDGIKWLVSFIREWWVPMLTTLAAISFWFSHLSIPSRILIIVPLAGWFIQGVISIIKVTRLRSQINITVTMDDGFSHQQCITVTNHGEERTFTAECQILDSNRVPNYPKGLFRLGWGDGKQSTAKIPQFASDRILVANFEDVTLSHSLFKLSIWKLVGQSSLVQWWAQWVVEDKEELPYFKLKVTVIAQGTSQPWVRYFLLTPKTRLGPLGMSLVEATANLPISKPEGEAVCL